MESSKESWIEFLERYYEEQILELGQEYPEKRSLYIDFSDIEKYSAEIAEELLSRPDAVIENATDALKEIDLPNGERMELAIIRFKGLPELTRIRDIRSAHIGTMIAVTGMIRKTTEVRPMLMIAGFRCPRCNEITRVKQGEAYTEPFECSNDVCGRKAHFVLVPEESEFKDFQKIRIQDSPDDMRPGEQPQTLDAVITDDATGRISAGDRAVFVGILRSYQKSTQQGKSTTFEILLEASSIEVEEKGFEEIELSDEDEKTIIEMSKDKDIFRKIVDSIAPSIYGMKEVKGGMALQLFAGMTKKNPDGLKLRGDIHILLVGDPGIAKSQLLRYALTLAPRGVFTNGKGTSTAGLTATVVKDEEFSKGRWTLEAGSLVLADMGLIGVDELDKMDKLERSALHEAMAQQTISISKAGINVTLKARCALLGAANPKLGRFDKDVAAGRQIDLEPTLLSRFDLIFILKDEPFEQRDSALSKHILNTHLAGEMALRKEHVKDSGITVNQMTLAQEHIQPVFDARTLRKYIAYAKKTIYPMMTPSTIKRLNDFYISVRKLGASPDAPVPTTARSLEALIRLAEASARTRLSSEITEIDAERVIALVQTSLDQVIRDPTTGQLDSDIISTGIGKSQRERIRAIRETIRLLQKSGSAVPMELIVQTLEPEGIKRDDIIDAISRMKTNGDVIEASQDRYKVI